MIPLQANVNDRPSNNTDSIKSIIKRLADEIMIVHVTQYRVILQKNKHHFGKYRELQKCFHGTLHPIALYFMVLHVYSCKRIAWFCSVHWTVSSDN